jgi:hypothetical protein
LYEEICPVSAQESSSSSSSSSSSLSRLLLIRNPSDIAILEEDERSKSSADPKGNNHHNMYIENTQDISPEGSYVKAADILRTAFFRVKEQRPSARSDITTTLTGTGGSAISAWRSIRHVLQQSPPINRNAIEQGCIFGVVLHKCISLKTWDACDNRLQKRARVDKQCRVTLRDTFSPDVITLYTSCEDATILLVGTVVCIRKSTLYVATNHKNTFIKSSNAANTCFGFVTMLPLAELREILNAMPSTNEGMIMSPHCRALFRQRLPRYKPASEQKQLNEYIHTCLHAYIRTFLDTYQHIVYM